MDFQRALNAANSLSRAFVASSSRLYSGAFNTDWPPLLTCCQSTAITINHRVLRTILNTTATNPLTQIDSTFPSSSSMFQCLMSADRRKLGWMFLPYGSKRVVAEYHVKFIFSSLTGKFLLCETTKRAFENYSHDKCKKICKK